VQSPGFKITDFLIGDVNLEADDISVLDIALREDLLRVHELNQAGFDFLRKDDVSARHIGKNPPSVTS